jgi:hypothetical protein
VPPPKCKGIDQLGNNPPYIAKGGGDINGTSSFGSNTDYHFRAPNVFLLRETVEHSVGKWPVSVVLAGDQGKVALLLGDLGSNPWIQTFSTGIDVRAGGFPP